MDYISLAFAGFMLALIVLMFFIKSERQQSIILLAASYIFYALGDYRFLILLIGVSALMWFLGLCIERDTKKSLYLAVGIVIDVLILGVFKYFSFFAENFCRLLKIDYSVANVLLPLGISFYIFQSISYLADIYKGKIKAERNPIYVFLYIGFFPQIISGPIVKARDLLPQLHKSHTINFASISAGGQRFLLGVFKKKVIADRLCVCVDAVYAAPAAYSSLSIFMAVVTYSLQLYFDFSGYSDMAIGVAEILGFDLGDNFNLPYLATNPSDFWKRWHISLSSWFREYVYIPLGGSRKVKSRTYLNVFITMLVSGLWHGASWAFIIWGLLHAAASVLHKVFSDLKKKFTGKECSGTKVGKGIAVLLNFLWVSILWIPFRTNDLSKAWYIICRMFTHESGILYIYDYSLIFILLMLIVEIYAIIKNKWNNPIKPLDTDKFWNKVIISVLMIVTFIFAYVGDTAFIYGQF